MLRQFCIGWIAVLVTSLLAAPAAGQWQSNSNGIHYDGGRIGIGTSNPSYDLEIGESVDYGFSVGTGGDGGRIWTEYTEYGPTLIFYDYDDRSIIRFRESPSTDEEHSPGHEATIVGRRGNIGIGHLKPPEALSVAGNVLAEEVIVKPQDQWADYVFEPGYELPSLEAVGFFIEKNGHLPDVPSAEDVKKNGLRLGEMDATLLQKVEELTLYAIGQKERADSLASQVQQLRSRSEAQEDRLDALERQNEKLRNRHQKKMGAIRKQLQQLRQRLQDSPAENR